MTLQPYNMVRPGSQVAWLHLDCLQLLLTKRISAWVSWTSWPNASWSDGVVSPAELHSDKLVDEQLELSQALQTGTAVSAGLLGCRLPICSSYSRWWRSNI